MSILIIGPEEEAAIAKAVAAARAKIIPLHVLREIATNDPKPTLNLKDRKRPFLVEAIKREYPSQQVMLGTYRVALTFQEQPDGLAKHLSVSSARKGRVPGLEVMNMVMDAFGFSSVPLQLKNQPAHRRMWLEEFEPGWHAVNVIELEAP